MLLIHALPEIAAGFIRGFEQAGRPDIAGQVGRLELADRCRCGDDSCATFYTRPNESWEGRAVERFVPDVPGLTCLYAVDGVVAWTELLWRPDVRDRLRELLPSTESGEGP